MSRLAYTQQQRTALISRKLSTTHLYHTVPHINVVHCGSSSWYITMSAGSIDYTELLFLHGYIYNGIEFEHSLQELRTIQSILAEKEAM